jgi:hypothetical protein
MLRLEAHEVMRAGAALLDSVVLMLLQGKFTLNSHHGTQGWGRPEEAPLPKIESSFFDIFIHVHPDDGTRLRAAAARHVSDAADAAGFIVYFGGRRHCSFQHRFPWAGRHLLSQPPAPSP